MTEHATPIPPDPGRKHGGEVHSVAYDTHPGRRVGVEHPGADLHETVPPGEQCRCGWINLGVKR